MRREKSGRAVLIAGAFAAAAAAAAVPAGSAAQVADTGQAPADTFALPEIVVTATRLPLRRGALPVPVTVLMGDSLRARGVRSLAEALRGVPGVEIASAGPDGAQTSLFLRGGESDYVKVLVDGVPLNDPGGAIDLADLDLTNVERIEVVRGPASVLYGSDAVTGVIQIFTRRGHGPPKVTASALPGLGARRDAAGSYPTLDLEADLSGGDAGLGYSLGISRYRSDGLLPLNNGYRNRALSGRLSLAGRGSDIAANLRYHDAEYHYPTDGAGNVVDTNAVQDGRTLTLSVDAGHDFGGRVQARLLATDNETRRTFRDRQDGPADTLGTYAGNGRQRQSRRSLDGRLNLFLSAADVLTVGAMLERGAVDGGSQYASQYGPIGGAIHEQRTTRALYAQLVTTPLPHLHAQLGVRREHNDAFGVFGTYRLGASYGLTPTTRLRAAFGTAFREPSFAESYGSGYGDVGNPDLGPERTRTWEAGIRQTALAGHVDLSATYFDQRFTDLIQYTFTTPMPGAPNYYNVGGATARGIELDADWALTRAVGLEGQVTLLRTRVTDQGLASDSTFVQGMRLLRRTPVTAGARVRWTVAHGVTARLGLRHTGPRDDVDFGASTYPSPRITLPPVTTVQLSGDYTFDALGQHTTAVLRIHNLLDAHYQEIAGFPARGRTVALGLRVRF
ncbi:MAG: TonB-dependent receptor [Gemmatimonadota bacterium]|jgi:vitamin B12 transporter